MNSQIENGLQMLEFKMKLTDIDREFIKKNMHFHEGHAEIGGFLVLAYIQILFGSIFIFSLIAKALNENLNVMFLIGYVVILLIIVLIFIASSKRKKLTKFLFLSYYILELLISIIGQISFSPIVVVMIIYFSVSQRVKFTYVN
jgi:hypothetical protein